MKVSIVTVHLNDFDGLDRTLNSIEQSRAKYRHEWIIIDGGSEPVGDGSCLERVRLAADHFISEPDNGIYDAMNKGTRLASGDYVLFLNAGDELHPGFDYKEITDTATETSPDMVWGGCDVQYQDNAQIRVKARSPSWAWYCMPAFHPAILFRREVLGADPYDTDYSFAADYDLVCRLLKNDATVSQLSSPFAIYHRGGVSDVEGDHAREEENDIRLKHFHLPVFIGETIKAFKKLNAGQTMFSRFVRQLRKRI